MSTDLTRLLNSIVKATFVCYYEIFSDESLSNSEIIEALPAEYTLKSRRSRTSKSRRIFREGLEVEALTLIASSDFVDVNTAERAQQLLNRR